MGHRHHDGGDAERYLEEYRRRASDARERYRDAFPDEDADAPRGAGEPSPGQPAHEEPTDVEYERPARFGVRSAGFPERRHERRHERGAMPPGWSRDLPRDPSQRGRGPRDFDAYEDLRPGRRPDRAPREGRYAGRGPRGYQRSDDRIREDVCDQLTADPFVDATEITVAVAGGDVTLEGTVDDRAMKHWAEYIVEDLPGVREVHNRLTVRRPDTQPGTTSGAGNTS